MVKETAAGRRLVVALDVADAGRAEALVDRLAPAGCAFKVGLELLYALGPGWVDRLTGRGLRVFADAKLHDIPNTVFRAARALAARGAWMITLHVAGGAEMVRAALEGAAEGAAAAGHPRPLVVGVTVLTSLDEGALREATGTGSTLAAEVVRRAELARRWGLDGVVCAPVDLKAVRRSLGPGMVLVTPGIRPAGAPAGDQRRVATPAAAAAAGADYLVVGRPVTAAADPLGTLEAIAAQVAQAGAAAAGTGRGGGGTAGSKGDEAAGRRGDGNGGPGRDGPGGRGGTGNAGGQGAGTPPVTPVGEVGEP